VIRSCLRHTGFGPPTVDAAAALAMSSAAGVPADVAVELINSAAMGVMAGAVDRKDAEQEAGGQG
jgi:hypothetical protein